MGVDVAIFIKVSDQERYDSLTDEKLLELSKLFCDANGVKAFEPGLATPDGSMITKRSEVSALPGRWLYVETRLRWYGVGYERGNWPLIYGCVQWCRLNFPMDDVYLISDHDDMMETTGIVNDESMHEVWEHWAEFGTEPYYGAKR